MVVNSFKVIFMYSEIRFALFIIRKNFQSSAELRSSFVMNIVGMAINNTAFIFLWVFFVQSVGEIGGWKAVDIVGLQGFIALCYGVVFSVGVGIRNLPEYAATGAFDRFMISPKNLLLRVATSAFSPSALGDVIFGLVCLGFFAVFSGAGLAQMVMLVPLVFFTIVVFFSITLATHALSFYFVDGGAVVRGLFELFMTPSLFHGGAFQGALRFVFTFIVPSLLIGALPVESFKSLDLVKFGIMAILTLTWFMISLVIFRASVKKYESSNFMTFGN